MLLTLANPGEMFIVEDWTYPSAMAVAQPYGISPVGVPMDGQGMRSDELRKLLAGWDEAARGAKRYDNEKHLSSKHEWLTLLGLPGLTFCTRYPLARTRPVL